MACQWYSLLPCSSSVFLAASGSAMLGISSTRFAGVRSAAAPLWIALRGAGRMSFFVLADDMDYGDLSILGQTNFQTPNLDKMAEGGMIQADHYAGSTVCAPSRVALPTGQHTGHVYQRGNGQIAFRPDPHDITIAMRLKKGRLPQGDDRQVGPGLQFRQCDVAQQEGVRSFLRLPCPCPGPPVLPAAVDPERSDRYLSSKIRTRRRIWSSRIQRSFDRSRPSQKKPMHHRGVRRLPVLVVVPSLNVISVSRRDDL